MTLGLRGKGATPDGDDDLSGVWFGPRVTYAAHCMNWGFCGPIKTCQNQTRFCQGFTTPEHLAISVEAVLAAKTTDIGEKLALLDVVVGRIALRQPAAIVVKNSIFGW